MTALDTYRGWEIGYEPPPIPWRESDWYALMPDHLARCDGDCIYAGSREELVQEIDEFMEEVADA